MTDYISVRAALWAIKSVCKMLLILARLNACESRGSALLTIRSGKTFNEQRHRHAAAGGLLTRLGKSGALIKSRIRDLVPNGTKVPDSIV